MLTEQEFDELLAYQASHPVLSVYLNTDALAGNDESALPRLRAMLRGVDLPQDTEAILGYMEREYDGKGRSVAFFSCAAEGFFRAYPLAIPLQDRVRVHDRPHVKPLANLLERYGYYGVVLVDSRRARVFTFHLGVLQEHPGFTGKPVHRTKRGGGSQYPEVRGGTPGKTDRVEETIEQNMKRAADFAVRFLSRHKVRHLLLAGTEENVALFRQYLPKQWQNRVAGTFPVSMNAGLSEIQEQARRLVAEYDRQEEANLVEDVITAAAKGREGAVGLDDVLEAARAGRILTLLVSEGYHQSGYVCQSCGYTTATQADVCPFCGGRFSLLPDAVEYAIRHVMQSNGEVEIVQDVPKLQEIGGVAALLRY